MAERKTYTEVRWADPDFHEGDEYDVLYKGNRLGAFWFWLTLPTSAKVWSTRVRVTEVTV